MTKMRFWALACVIAIVTTTAAADGHDLTLPADVSHLADEIVSMVIDSVPRSVRNPALVAVRSVELNGSIPPFGELLAMTVSTRIAVADEAGLRVRTHYPVDSYLSEFSSTGPNAPTEGDFSVTPDYVVIGESFEAEGQLHLLFQLIEVGSETILTGLEDTLALDPWLLDLLRVSGYSEGGGFTESDRFEPDSVDDPLYVIPDETVGERTIGPAGDTDWFVVSAEDIEGRSILTVFTSGETDTYIEAYGPDDPDIYIAENDDGENANASLSVLIEGGQRIWVLVRGYDETVEGTYSFHSELAAFEDDPSEPDNSLEEANQLMVGYGVDDFEPLTRTLMPSGDEDWYFVDVSDTPDRNTILSVETRGGLDTFLDLYDSTGLPMLENDDGGEGDNGRIDLFIEKAGRYYVKVRHYDGSDQGEYQVFAQFVQATPDQWEPDDSRGEARETEPNGTPQTKNFTPADDQDWVTFTLGETSTVEIKTTGDVDTYIRLFDRLGNAIAEDDDGGDDYNALIERLLQTGQYFIRIHQVEGDAVFGAEYTLQIIAD
jgi:hypothetical protein